MRGRDRRSRSRRWSAPAAARTTTSPTADPAFGSQPNFVFILTDDQNLTQFNRRYMRRTRKLIADPGTEFTNYFAATPLCCPSRAAVLTGQYGHNNGVLSNMPGYALLREPENILPAWLQTAGYQTAEVGKWLNGYEKTVEDHEEVPPGLGQVARPRRRPRLLQLQGLAERQEAHLSPVHHRLDRRDVDRSDRQALGRRPAVLPAGQRVRPARRDRARAEPRALRRARRCPRRRTRAASRESGLPNSPSINEADVSDKPNFVAGKSELTQEQLELLALRYECRLEALRSLDRSIGKIMQAIEDSGELDDTVVIFASDNGTFHGEHRLPGGKGLAYDEAAHMPLAMLVPEKYRGGNPVVPTISEPTSNIDLAPTIVDLAGLPDLHLRERVPGDGRALARRPRWRGTTANGLRTVRCCRSSTSTSRRSRTSTAGSRAGSRASARRNWLYIEHTVVPDPGARNLR